MTRNKCSEWVFMWSFGRLLISSHFSRGIFKKNFCLQFTAFILISCQPSTIKNLLLSAARSIFPVKFFSYYAIFYSLRKSPIGVPEIGTSWPIFVSELSIRGSLWTDICTLPQKIMLHRNEVKILAEILQWNEHAWLEMVSSSFSAKCSWFTSLVSLSSSTMPR